MRRISEIFARARVRVKVMGPSFDQALCSKRKPLKALKLIKESLELGFFVQAYNRTHRRHMVYSTRHRQGTKRADYSVFDVAKKHICDIELTALWDLPGTWREEPDRNNPGDTHVYIDEPPKHRALKDVRRVVTKHLRSDYGPYWLVIYNNVQLNFHGLDESEAAKRVEVVLRRRKAQLPPGLKRVWIWSHSRIDCILCEPRTRSRPARLNL